MTTLSPESVEQQGLDKNEPSAVEKGTAINSPFVSRITYQNGYYGKIDNLTEIIRKQTGWSDDIVNSIRSPEQYKLFRDLGLVEARIGGKPTLILPDIDLAQVDEKGWTNAKRMENGKPPITKSGDVVDLHHNGQKANSPLVQMPETEHRGKGYDLINHDKTIESDAHSDANKNAWNKERPEYWKASSDAEIVQQSAFKLGLKTANETGIKSGLSAAGITAAISTVDNIQKYCNGEITAQEAFVDVAKDSGTAAAIGYGTGFITSAVASATQNSAHAMIRTLGNANVTAAAISFGIESYDDVVDYAQGNITGQELAVNLGGNATGVAGAMAGAQVGATVGSVVGPVGTVAGGLVGGMVGYAVATEAYATAVEVAKGGVDVVVEKAEAVAETAVEAAVVVADVAVAVADVAVDVAVTAAVNVADGAVELKNKAVEMGQSVIDSVAENAPEALESVKTAMNDFASNLGVIFNW